jgi:phage terminase large subunit GpA-like protein
VQPLPCSPAFARVVRSWAEIWRPRQRPCAEQWVEQNIRLPARTSAKPGRYRFAGAPYARGVFRAFDDRETAQITCVWATQTTKTTILQSLMAYVAKVLRSPALLVTPDIKSNRKLRDKFRSLCLASPSMHDTVPGPRQWNDQQINFSHSICYLGYAGSTQTLSGESCQYVFATEVDRYRHHRKQGDSLAKARQRMKAFFRSLFFVESSPTDDTSPIYTEWDKSDQREFYVPCPHCGHYQPLRFFEHRGGRLAGRGGVRGMRDGAGNWLPEHVVRDEAWYECESKGCRIESHDKPAMLQLGVWCPKGQSVDRRGRLIGTPERPARHAGFHLSSLYAVDISFGDVAAEYLLARDSNLAKQVFYNDWLALKWFHKAEPPKWQRVGQRLAGSHRRGLVPSWAIFLTAGADVQDDCVYFVVRAWGDGCRSALVDFQKCSPKLSEEGIARRSSDLDQLDPLVLERCFPLTAPNAAGRSQLRVRLLNIDCQGHRQAEVVEWVRKRRGRGIERVRTIAGDVRNVGAGEFFKLTTVEKNARTGKPYPGGMQRWAINVDAYKEDLRNRFDMPLDDPGAWLLYEKILEDGVDYLRQICNESKRVVKDKGRDIVRWEESDSKIGNHYWDCEIYGRAAADMVTGFDWHDLARQAQAVAARKRPRPPAGRPPESRPAPPSPYGPRS